MLADPLNWAKMSIQIKFPGCADKNFTQLRRAMDTPSVQVSACVGEHEQETAANVPVI